MEGVPYDWSDYLRSEGLSDIAPTGLGMQGGQTGQDGCPQILHKWHDQQLASRHTSYNANQSQGYNTVELSPLDHEEDLVSLAHEYESIASQDQYRHHGSTSNLETSESGFDPAQPEQVPSSNFSPIKTGPAQTVLDLGAILTDEICACAACLGGQNFYSGHFFIQKLKDEHPELESRTFACRVSGCQWTTMNDDRRPRNVYQLWFHEMAKSHYGKPGNWRCREANCKSVTKRFGDLKRHYSSKHCIKPKKLKCPVLSCIYHQDGFTRKDKLDSHYQKVHGGKSRPGKPNQAIKPKVGDSA